MMTGKMKIVGLIFVSLLLCTSTPSFSQKKDRSVFFPNDSVFLDHIQKVHFNYMWDGAEKTSGMALERIHLDQPNCDPRTITVGGSGFGVAGILSAIHRRFISRKEGFRRLSKIVDYLTDCDRFHGVWPHWIDGPTGKVKPFSKYDDGGDLVESCFLMQSLLCVREYYKNGNRKEKALCRKIDRLWHEMEFDWYQNGRNVLYWHWSPNCGWKMNFALQGYNETFIVYLLAIASPTHSVPVGAYHEGWARNGRIRSDAKFYGLDLYLSHNGCEHTGGPLFWAQYSYLCLNPIGLSDRYADYGQVVRNHVLSDYRYCVDNPKRFKGYGKDCWGLTASYSTKGYMAHSPGRNDVGVITPTAALSSFPFTPEESMAALKFFYSHKDRIWGKYGFYDAFSIHDNWTVPRYLAIDQCTISPMIENYRSGLLWNLFMGCPEVKKALKVMGFTVNGR